MANIKTITITDATQPQINAAFIALTSATKGLEVDIKAVDSAWKAANKDLQQQIESIRRGTIVYSAGANINISSTGVISATVPTKTSQLQNDSGFITSASVPTKTSELQNDSGFITSASIPTKTSDLQNDSGFITSSDVGDGTITIQMNGVDVKSFSMNQSSSDTVNITVPTELSDFTNDLPSTNNMFCVFSDESGEADTKLAVSESGIPINNGNTHYSEVLVWMQNRRANGESYDAARYIKFNNGYSFRIWTNGTGADFQGGTTMKASMSLPFMLYLGGVSENRFHIRPAFNYAYNNEPANVGDSSRYRMFYAPLPATNGNTYGGRPHQLSIVLQYGSTSTTGTVWGFWMGNAYTEYTVNWNGRPISSSNYNIPPGVYNAQFIGGTVYISEKPRNPEYTYVVDSDAALTAWGNNTAGNDYTSVLIKKGTWTTNRASTINLSTTGTKVIVGEPGSKLVFTGQDCYFFYNSVPTTSDYYIQGLTLEHTVSNTYSWCIGLKNCANISDTVVTCTATTTSTTIQCFENCQKLINCTGIANSATSSRRATAFAYCANVKSCKGISTYDQTYLGCDILIGCDATTGRYHSYYNCSNMQYCYGTSLSSTAYRCVGLIYCTIRANESYAINECTNVDSCSGLITGTFQASYPGIANSKVVRYCTATNGVYASSYASRTANSTYACANTLNGGWNG